jgi:tRNA A-37 threonylcarbamoyl transferase component Bud32
MTPGTTLGRYVVRRKLAEGGMAEIFLAAVEGPEGFEKEVVIKRIRSHFASEPGFVRMFVDEARVASRLHHPNIVQIFDFDRHEDSYYIAMEYVRGHSLWELRRRCRELVRPLPPVLSAWVGAEVARALEHAHGLELNGERVGLVHRDVTPHNVLLSFDGAVKLGDFGIARVGQGLTAPGTLKGKFAYMSPEQARGEPVDARTDVFALGIVLWELLTGGRLFEGSNELAILRAVQGSEIAPPARLNPDVPARLSEIVLRALSRDPAGRFQSAGEFERALREVLLAEARSVEDTDLGAFLRAAFAPAPPVQDSDPAAAPLTPAGRETAPARGQAADRGAPRGGVPASEELPTVVVPRGDDSANALTEAVQVPGEESAAARPASPFGLRQALSVGGLAVLTGALIAAAAWRHAGSGQDAETERGQPPSAPGAAADTPPRRPAAVGPPKMTGAPKPPGEESPGFGAGPEPVTEPDAGNASAAEAAQDPAGSPAPGLPARSPATLRPPGKPSAALRAEAVHPAGASAGPRPLPTDAATALTLREGDIPSKLPAPAEPPSSSEVPSKSGAPATRPVPVPATGVLRLSVVPWAQVWVGSRELGEVAAQRDFDVPVGTHVLRLEHPRNRRELSVTIRAGETTVQALDLRSH